MIVKWGCDKADELGLLAYVGAAAPGKPGCLKHGFEKIDEAVIDCDRWPDGLGPGGKGKHAWTMMYRPPR